MGVLAGIRIVELDALGPVPLCAMLLADHGAEIVRIARPASKVVDDAVGGAILHRSRPSIALDLKTGEGRDTVLALVAQADAVLEGFRPGVMERLALGPAECLARNPRLVYARMTGWGQDGPLAQRAGHDINYLAITGALHMIGPADTPVPPLNLVADYAGGAMMLAFGVLAGILDARRTGQGQVVDTAMCDAVPMLLSLFQAFAQSGGWEDRRAANLLDGGAPFYRCYRCRDGGFVAVGALEPQFFRALMAGLDLAAEDYPQGDKSRWPAMAEAIAARFLTRSRDEWADAFAGTDACVSPVLARPESLRDTHLAARGVFVRREGLVEAAPVPRFSRGAGVASAPTRATADEILARWVR